MGSNVPFLMLSQNHWARTATLERVFSDDSCFDTREIRVSINIACTYTGTEKIATDDTLRTVHAIGKSVVQRLHTFHFYLPMG